MFKIKSCHPAVFVLFTLVVGEFVFFLYFVPRIRITKIIVKGNFFLSDQEIFSLLNWKKLPLYFTVNTRKIALTLHNTTGDDIRVSKMWPNRLIIQNSGLGPLFVSNVGNHRVYVNEDGLIIAGNDVVNKLQNIPELVFPSGVDPEDLYRNNLPGWFRMIGRLKRQSPKLYRRLKSVEQKKNSLYLQFQQIPFFVQISVESSVDVISHTYWQARQIWKSRIHIESGVLDMRENDIVYYN